MHTHKKNVAGSCALNFDATDLPHSLLEPSYPTVFRGRPEVPLVSTVCHPGSSRVRQPSFVSKKGDFEVFFGVQRIGFPGQAVNFCLEHVTHIPKAINLRAHLVCLRTRYVQPVTRVIFFNAWLRTGSISWNQVLCILSILHSIFISLLHIIITIEFHGGSKTWRITGCTKNIPG